MQFRISRGQWHVDAIRKGINDVIPLDMLDMFSAEELQRMWCADVADLDFDDWKEHIMANENVHPESVQYFLQYLEKSSDERRRDVSQLNHLVIDHV